MPSNLQQQLLQLKQQLTKQQVAWFL